MKLGGEIHKYVENTRLKLNLPLENASYDFRWFKACMFISVANLITCFEFLVKANISILASVGLEVLHKVLLAIVLVPEIGRAHV